MIRILLSARLGERRLTQADLARMTGIRAATINEYYNELTSKISLDHFDLICEALDCDLSDLLVLEPNEEPRLETHVSVPPRPRSKWATFPCPDALCVRAFLLFVVSIHGQVNPLSVRANKSNLTVAKISNFNQIFCRPAFSAQFIVHNLSCHAKILR